MPKKAFTTEQIKTLREHYAKRELDTLLLHELVELILDETTPDLSSLNSHIVATTFERYLKGTMLKVGVEDFFLEWPTLSEVEIEERQAAYKRQEIEELTAYFAEEEAPADDDLDDLPLDNVPVRKRRRRWWRREKSR